MTYQILIDGRDLYYPGDKEYTVSDAVVNLQLNDSGSFACGVPPINPEYDNILNRRSMIQVLKNGKEIFYGEVRESGKDFYGAKQVYAVGELAFLFDSIQPQARYQNRTSRQLLTTWINNHNSQVETKKAFAVGSVTVHDINDSLYRYTNQENTLGDIRDKLCEPLDGYLRIRKIGSTRFIDLVTLQEYGKISEQPIEFGYNLLDYTESLTSQDVYTSVIPRGARLDTSPIEGLEAYVDIKSVNGGKDYIVNEDASRIYGNNRCVVSWDDVTLPSNLLSKAKNWLSKAQYETLALDLSAADLSALDASMEDWDIGDYVPVYSAPHGMDLQLPVQALTINLQDPSADRVVLGNTMQLSYTSQGKSDLQSVKNDIDNTRQTTAWLQSAIDNATNMMTGSTGGYKVTEYDDDGRWLRDLYMNAPDKETASRVMQINSNGIGFSATGFNGPYKNAWTLDGVLLGQFIKAGTVTAEKLSVEYRQSVNDQIVSMFNVTSEMIEGRVEKDGFGTYVQQFYDRIILGYNNSSRYVQIDPGAISIYDGSKTKSKLRSTMDQNGVSYYRDGYFVGTIGTNSYGGDTTKKGLVFNLEYQGAYMGWSARSQSNDKNYYFKLFYVNKKFDNTYTAGRLHAGCDLDMHNFAIRNANIVSLSSGGNTSWSGTIPYVVNIEDLGDGGIGWSTSSIIVKNGIIISA